MVRGILASLCNRILLKAADRVIRHLEVVVAEKPDQILRGTTYGGWVILANLTEQSACKTGQRNNDHGSPKVKPHWKEQSTEEPDSGLIRERLCQSPSCPRKRAIFFFEQKSIFSLHCLLLIRGQLHHLPGLSNSGYVLGGGSVQAFNERYFYKNVWKES